MASTATSMRSAFLGHLRHHGPQYMPRFSLDGQRQFAPVQEKNGTVWKSGSLCRMGASPCRAFPTECHSQFNLDLSSRAWTKLSTVAKRRSRRPTWSESLVISSTSIGVTSIAQANILVDDHFRLRLTDFGLVWLADVSKETQGSYNHGAIRWMAPEVLSGCRPTYASDLYSFACVCVEVGIIVPALYEIMRTDST